MSDRITNKFKLRLTAGDDMLGLWFGLANNIAAEICAQSGFDWMLIDAEHSPLSDKDILSCLQAVAPYEVSPIVRSVSGDKNILKRLCDVGVQTFLVPMIDDAKQAEAVVSAVQYPPSGMCVILQIETKAGLKNLKKIAKVKGVDAVFIGPSDLGAALGYPGQPSHPEVIKAVSQAIQEVRACGKPAGVLAVTSELVETYKAAGASFVGVGSDCGVLAKGVQRLYESFALGSDAKRDY